MTYAAARTELQSILQGATARITDGELETLTALEVPPASTPLTGYPYAVIHSPRRVIEHPPMMRHTVAFMRVEILLGPYTNHSVLSQRVDAWVEALAALSDVSLSLNQEASIADGWEFSELRESPVYEGVWGFDVTWETHFYEAKANDG